MIQVLIGVIVGLTVALVVSWWQRRPRRANARTEMCCRCNAAITGRKIHVVAEQATDDVVLADGYGDVSTGVAADFCVGCCPGGCRRHHWPVLHRLRRLSARRRVQRQRARLVM